LLAQRVIQPPPRQNPRRRKFHQKLTFNAIFAPWSVAPLAN
jgi:hypothetical protein